MWYNPLYCQCIVNWGNANNGGFFSLRIGQAQWKIIPVFALHFKLVQCGYQHTVFTAHRLSATNEAPPCKRPYLTTPTHLGVIWKMTWKKCLLTPQRAPGLAQLLCLPDSRWQSESLAAGTLCLTDGINKCLSRCRSRDAGSPHCPEWRHPIPTEGYINRPQPPGRNIRMGYGVLWYFNSFQ